MNTLGEFDISDEQFQEKVLQSHRPVLVEFWADWCGACHILRPIVKDLSETFEGEITICRVDVEIDDTIGRMYGIRDLPALLFFRNGRLVDHLIGIAPKAVIAEKFQRLIDRG